MAPNLLPLLLTITEYADFALSGLGLVALTSWASAGLALARRRRIRQWASAVEAVCSASQRSGLLDLRRADRARRAAEFIDRFNRRAYYTINIVCAASLAMLPQLFPARVEQAPAWLALTGLSFASALFLLATWSEQHEEHEAELQCMLSRAIDRSAPAEQPNGSAPGLYPRQLWVAGLQAKLAQWPANRAFSCVVFELAGGSASGADSQAVELALSWAGREIVLNLRRSDRICRYGEYQFAAALPDCTAEQARQSARRVAANLQSLVLDGLNRKFGTDLRLDAGIAPLVWECRSVGRVLRDMERDLERNRHRESMREGRRSIGDWRTIPLAAN